jgi:hypothetical protein
MRSPKIGRALAITIGAIFLSVIGPSVARTLPVSEDPRPTRSPQIRIPERRAASAPNLGQTNPHVKSVAPAKNGRRKELVIDPALKFVSTFGAAATVYAIAVDQAGDSYIGGYTEAQGFTTTPGAFQTTNPSPIPTCCYHGFVAKITPTPLPTLSVGRFSTLAPSRVAVATKFASKRIAFIFPLFQHLSCPGWRSEPVKTTLTNF